MKRIERRRRRRVATGIIEQPNCFSESAQQLLFGLMWRIDSGTNQPSLPRVDGGHSIKQR